MPVAVNAVCKVVRKWDPSATEKLNPPDLDIDGKSTSRPIHHLEKQNTESKNRITYYNFNVDTVLSKGVLCIYWKRIQSSIYPSDGQAKV
ncbi:uncharacterized protein VP01_1928g10 [Puccinia sorghi]|uniref:Uncharacterized protein n=1 Tax=Puccinia sorghi TaxID=27349 RepID=A0A0L6VD22_9BASI|nr:uncharacterized protein VP01_1928g10 [Puccinia sorghi]